MKRTTSSIVLAVLVATGAVGCGSENPTGPSFARSTPVAETAGGTMTLTPEPGSIDNGTGTGEIGEEAVEVRPRRKARKPRPTTPGNSYGLD